MARRILRVYGLGGLVTAGERQLGWRFFAGMACSYRKDAIAPQPHGGGFAGQGPLPQPEIGPEILDFRAIEAKFAEDSAHLHLGLLAGGIPRPIPPAQGAIGYPDGARPLGKGREIGFQRGVGMEIGQHGNTAQYEPNRSAKQKVSGGDVISWLRRRKGVSISIRRRCGYGRYRWRRHRQRSERFPGPIDRLPLDGITEVGLGDAG